MSLLVDIFAIELKPFIDEWERRLHERMANNLETAAIYLENEVKKELGQKYPPASLAGEFPHLRSGELRRSITHEVDRSKLVARVGSNKKYSRYLERSTSTMEGPPISRTHITKRVAEYSPHHFWSLGLCRNSRCRWWFRCGCSR